MKTAASMPALLGGIYLNPDYYPPTFNAVNLLRRDFRVHLLCRNHQASFRRWPADVDIRRLGEYATMEQKKAMNPLAKLREYRAFVGALRAALETVRPSVIYAWEPFAFAAFCRAGALRRGIPIIYHLHELPDENPSVASMSAWVRRYALRRTRDAAAVVFPEENRAEHYLRMAGDARPAIIAPNCPARDFLAISDAEIAATAEQRRLAREIVYIGSIGPEHCNLEQALALRHLRTDTRITLIGWAHGVFAADLARAAAAAGARDRFSMPGPIPHHRLPDRALRASIGLAMYKPLNRNLEYMASATNKLFEYAACGLPVIAPDLPNFRDFLRGERWVAYADPYDPASIAAAAETIFADADEYARMSAAARRFFTERYHYERVFEPLLNRIREMAGIASSDEPVRAAAQ